MRRPLFPFALTEKLTRNVGISLGFSAAALGKGVRAAPSAARTNLDFVIRFFIVREYKHFGVKNEKLRLCNF